MPGDHVIGNVGERGHLGRDRYTRLVELGKGFPDTGDGVVGQEVEFYHPGFDDLVPPRIETRRLGVQKNTGFGFLSDGRRKRGAGDQTPQDTIGPDQLR
jgi:hypothetical protein